MNQGNRIFRYHRTYTTYGNISIKGCEKRAPRSKFSVNSRYIVALERLSPLRDSRIKETIAEKDSRPKNIVAPQGPELILSFFKTHYWLLIKIGLSFLFEQRMES